MEWDFQLFHNQRPECFRVAAGDLVQEPPVLCWIASSALLPLQVALSCSKQQYTKVIAELTAKSSMSRNALAYCLIGLSSPRQEAMNKERPRKQDARGPTPAAYVCRTWDHLEACHEPCQVSLHDFVVLRHPHWGWTLHHEAVSHFL